MYADLIRVLLMCTVIGVGMSALDFVAEKTAAALAQTDGRGSTHESARVFAGAHLLCVDLPIVLFASLTRGVSLLAYLAIIPIVVGRVVMGVGNESGALATVSQGRMLYLVPEVVLFIFPIMGWLFKVGR